MPDNDVLILRGDQGLSASPLSGAITTVNEIKRLLFQLPTATECAFCHGTADPRIHQTHDTNFGRVCICDDCAGKTFGELKKKGISVVGVSRDHRMTFYVDVKFDGAVGGREVPSYTGDSPTSPGVASTP